MRGHWTWSRLRVAGVVAVTIAAADGAAWAQGTAEATGAEVEDSALLKARPVPWPPDAVPDDAPGMAEYVAALKVYDAAVEGRETDEEALPETFDLQFREALGGFEKALAAAGDPKVKLECLYRVWRCHAWLRDEEGAETWDAFAAQLQRIEDAEAREQLIRWQLTRRRTRADWDGAVKLLEWVAATNEGTPLERWAQDELAWTLFLPLKRYPEAMKLCQEIVQKWPDGDEARRAHFRLGMMWRCYFNYRVDQHRDTGYDQQEQIRAKPHFELLLQRWPESLEARLAKVQLEDISLLLAGQKKVRVGIVKSRKAAREDPKP